MRYIQDPKTLKLIPADEYVAESDATSFQVMPDIKPYRSMIDGSVISSRSQHRAHLKQHGCVEVGNDSTVKNPTYKPIQSPPGLKESIIRAVDQHTRKR